MATVTLSRRRRIGRLTVRRVGVMVPLLALITAGVFGLAAFSPFNPLVAYLGDRYQGATPEQLESLRMALELDAGWWASLSSWVSGLVAGDLGYSRAYTQPVSEVIAERLPWTLMLSATGLLVAILCGTAAGLWAGLRPGSLADRILTVVALLIQSVPPFVLGLGAITVFALSLGWFPDGGATPVTGKASGATVAHHMVLPATVLGVSQAPWLALSLKESVQEALSSDPVRSAMARGLAWPTIVRRHILPVSAAPFITLVGARLPELVAGAVLVEEIFAWPGIAAATVTAARSMDMALLVTLALATAVLVLIGSLLADIGYILLDPRVEIDA